MKLIERAFQPKMADVNNPVKAGIWMLGSIFAFSLMAVAGRSLASEIDTFEIMFYRSIIGIIIVLTIGRWAGTLREIKTTKIKLHALRNISHFAGQNLWFFALTTVPLSQLIAFEFSTPLLVAILAPFFLKEKLTPTRGFAAFLGFIGILFVARPDTSSFTPHIIAAALCAFGFAGATIATKALTRTDSTTCIMFWLVTMQAVFGLVCAGYDGDIIVPDIKSAYWLVVIGLCGLSAHFCITKAVQIAPAIIVAPIDFLRLPLISVVAFFLYDEILEWPIFVGASIVFAANLFNIYSELKQKKQPAKTV